jgi:hypothetical protein
MGRRMNSKGTILTLVLIFSIILALTGMAFLYLSSQQRIVTIREMNRVKSFYLAEAGIERTFSWLMCYPGIPEETYGYGTPFDPFNGEQYLGPDGGYYKVIVYPEAQNKENPAELYYTISSTGNIGNVSKCIMQRIKIINFARFAYFSNYEYEGGAENVPIRDRIYFATCDKFEGPVHSNDLISIAGHPTFSDIDKDGRLDITTAKGFYFLSSDLESELPLKFHKTPEILMLRKWNIERLRNIAEQQKNANPSTGLVLNGPQNIVLEDTKLKYNGDEWDIPPSSAIVFVNGDIVSLKSGKDRRGNIFELERWLTIVSSGSIYITDNIKYKYDAGKKEYEGMLGIVASSSVVVSTTAPSNLEIDAVIVALGGSFFVEDWNTKFDKSSDESQPVGYLTVFGGVIQNIRRPVGTATPVSNDTITGYNKASYKYDDRVLKKPPPFFPKAIVVEPIYWKELPTQVNL